MRKERITTASISLETLEQLQFLSDKSGLTAKRILAELVGSVFDIACTFKDLNFEYESSVLASSITITLSGRNNLHSGCTKESFEEEKERIKKVKRE